MNPMKLISILFIFNFIVLNVVLSQNRNNCYLDYVNLTADDVSACNGNYTLMFEDDFNGNTLDLSKWRLPTDGLGQLQGSDKLGYYTLDNVEVSNGICHIIAKRETVFRDAIPYCGNNCTCFTPQDVDNCILADGLPNLRQFDYTTSNLWTNDKFSYGKYEIRCRMPIGNGFWPAFWMYDGPVWSEIDVFDNYGGITNWETGIGYGNTGQHDGCPEEFTGGDFSQWHTFTCYYSPAAIGLAIDGQLKRVVYRYYFDTDYTPITCEQAGIHGSYYELQAYPRQPMHIIINLQIGSGSGPSIAPDASTPFPNSFDIDYVKFWKLDDPLLHCDGSDILVGNLGILFPNFLAQNELAASNSILTFGPTIANGTKHWTAGSSIDLYDGFEVDAGSNFLAEIAPCDNSGNRSMNSSSNKDSLAHIKLLDTDLVTTNMVYDIEQSRRNKISKQGEKSEINISVLPNPNNGKFIVLIPDIQLKSDITIYDVLGKTIWQKFNTLETSITIDISDHPKGLYTLTLVKNGQINIIKIVFI